MELCVNDGYASAADEAIAPICNVGNCGTLRKAIDEMREAMLLSEDNFVVESWLSIQKKYNL